MKNEKLRLIIERILVERRLSPQNSESIKRIIYSKKEVTVEDMKLFRELQDRIWQGEIHLGD